ncbi:putative short-chain dehydrogenase/reductase family 42E member 1 [Apostichopus japonicus]|uniref:Putative short-chain dehydrogenase/reductase family 42E member 1 n=1 Tax=Stichopus japonicus TaxID=307972 RepID=A0A2G8LJR7_STIJA|nr:putative short-chain dehydrogenase/reductase family 42E member 1 [Apostichopus japonicus]
MTPRGLDVQSISGKHFLVTGGAGCFGMHLGRALHLLGGQVTLLDKTELLEDCDPSIKFIQGDIRNQELLMKACAGVNCVFHIASYGMSGIAMRRTKLVEEVNVGGTSKLLKACLENNVERMVYTSTHNVIFNGNPIENGDESLPYIPLDEHKDDYSRTKCMAEQLILTHSGKKTKDGHTFRSSACRAVAIYGRGEQRQFPQVMLALESGVFLATFGSKDILSSRVHIDNLTNAHILAADALCEHKNHISAGEAYIITDPKPQNQFVWMAEFVEAMGYSMPRLIIPVFVVLTIEVVETVMEVTLFLSRTELYQVCVTYHYKPDKARKQLGFVAVERGLEDTIEYYRARGHQRKEKDSLVPSWVVTVIIGLLFAAVLISFLPTAQ